MELNNIITQMKEAAGRSPGYVMDGSQIPEGLCRKVVIEGNTYRIAYYYAASLGLQKPTYCLIVARSGGGKVPRRIMSRLVSEFFDATIPTEEVTDPEAKPLRHVSIYEQHDPRYVKAHCN